MTVTLHTAGNIQYLECIWSETSQSANSLHDSKDAPSFAAETSAAELVGYASSSLCFSLLFNISTKKKKLNRIKRSTLIYFD